MKQNIILLVLGIVAYAVSLNTAWTAEPNAFRPPSVPLVVHDPYFSIWSPADKLTDAETVHWTGKKHPLHMMVRIDGKPYRLMGAEPKDVPAMEQKSVEVGPFSTKYVFENETAQFCVCFTTELFPGDLDLLSRPVTYVFMQYQTKDTNYHDVDFYFDASAEIAVNTPDQLVEIDINSETMNRAVISLGTKDQNVLGKRGDDVRIDWGRLIVSARPYSSLPLNTQLSFHDGRIARKEFIDNGKLVTKYTQQSDGVPAGDSGLAIMSISQTKETRTYTLHPILIAYDDEYSVRYFGDDLRPWWKRNGKSSEEMIDEAWQFWVEGKCAELTKVFETPFMKDLTDAFGPDYAKLCALAYRHSLGAQKIVADTNGMPLMFSKENFSNGSMGTVDLMYPCGPLYLYYSPALTKATLQPIFAYSESPKWKFPFAPHDIGTYPHGTGQTYGGGERSEENQMPVEESANMIILTAALAVAEQKPDFAKLHWNTLTKWADYLLEKGFDPENQLCTDDFAGHLAHNVNLSAKAIVALGAYAQLAEKLGEKDVAKKYRDAAEAFVKRWIKEADDGDHFRLAFDKPGTWSMKYNIMWDEILDLKLFPKEVMQKEIAYYKTKMQKYGLPLDNRSLYSKNDWILWVATMCENREDFDAFVKPVVAYVNHTENRVPLSDWYFTDSAKQRGFQARSVVGGFWAPMLKNREKWLAQSAKGVDCGDHWAPITLPGEPLKTIAPTAEEAKVLWRYTKKKPADGWEKPDFNPSAWTEGEAGFGTQGTPGSIIGTEWNSNDIWIRRTFEWDGEKPDNAQLALSLHHDEAVEVYINGVKVCQIPGWSTSYEIIPLPKSQDVFRKGVNTIAIHCSQTGGGQYIDAGIMLIETKKAK